MKRMFIKLFFIAVLLLLFNAYLSAQPAAATVETTETAESDPLFLTDVPLYFGEELFLKRLGLTSADRSGIAAASGEAGAGEAQPAVVKKKPLGLVFSGGAARAFAHIGVLKKLEEEGIFPDFIVANSMGSIVAMLYAAGASPAMIEKMIIDYPTDSLFRPEIPLNGGVLDTSRFTSLLYKVFGDLDISELKIPVAILSEDLETRRQVIFMEGDFYKILQASISMPFSFPPVEYNGMTLIDGGITNLTPVDTASEYTDRIIVSTAFYNRETDFRNFVTIINRAFDISKTRKGIGQLKNTDTVLIRCDVENFSFMDFQKMDLIIERGYESASTRIDVLKEKGFDSSVTWDTVRLDKLAKDRAEITENFKDVTEVYKRTGMAPQRELSGRMFAGFEMYSGIRDDYYLDNSDYLYLGQLAEIGYIQAGLREYYKPGAGQGLDSRLDFALAELIVFKNRFMLQWNLLDYDRTLLYNRVEFNLTKDGLSGIRPFFARESNFEKDREAEEQDSFTRSGIDLYTEGYLISSYWFNEYSGINGIGLENDFNIKIIGKFYLDQRTVYRTPFGGTDDISLYKNDGLRGFNTEGKFSSFVVTNNSFTFRTETSLSFGEILLVKNFAASVFYDYFLTEQNSLSAGLALDLDISFIGLTSLFLTAYTGYDYSSNRLFSSVVIGNNR